MITAPFLWFLPFSDRGGASWGIAASHCGARGKLPDDWLAAEAGWCAMLGIWNLISVRPLMSIEAFDNILLEDTFVLSWHQASASFTFNVLVSLLQSHPEALPPASGEWACYRSGVIKFSDVSSVSGLLRQESVTPTTDPDGTLDYGCIDDLSL